jgi:mono/diheme cytochrome c family protein
MLKLTSAIVAGLVTMGGWAVVTVKDLPEYFVAGRQYTVEFQVRQHGHTLLSNVEPELLMSTSPRRLAGLVGSANEQRMPAKNLGNGSYAVTFTAPGPGQVYLTIKSGWGASDLRLYPAAVVAAGVTPPTLPLADRGRMLFVAKGCNSCHTNIDLADRPDNQSIAIGPELGGRHLAREYVIQKVKNPNSEKMPNLGLSDAEAAAIAAFLSGDRAAASGR